MGCETASYMVEPCLDKGDMLFVVDTKNLVKSQNVTTSGNTLALATGAADSGDLYTISKIYKADPTAATFTLTGHEDRFRIVLDKNIPFGAPPPPPRPSRASSVRARASPTSVLLASSSSPRPPPATTSSSRSARAAARALTAPASASRATPRTTAAPSRPTLYKRVGRSVA